MLEFLSSVDSQMLDKASASARSFPAFFTSGEGGGGQGSSKMRFSHTYYSDSVLPSVGSLMSRKVGMLTVGFPTVATIGRLFSHMISHVFDKI